MARLVRCKACGARIAKSAKVCPRCGKRRRNGARTAAILLLVVLVLLVAVLLTDTNGPRKVGETAAGGETAVQEPAAAEQTVFHVGDRVELNDVVVTLVGVSESTGSEFMGPENGEVYLICEFDIENNSSRDIAVSSMLSFSAYVDGYALNYDIGAIVSTGKTQLDGTIAAGKKMNGVVAYSVSQQWSELEIRFTPDFWSGKEIVFSHSKV